MAGALRAKLHVDGHDWNDEARQVCVPGASGVESLDLYCQPRREPAIEQFARSVFTVPERRLAYDCAWLGLRAEVSRHRGLRIVNAVDYQAALDGRIVSAMERELSLFASRIPAEEMLVRCVRRVLRGTANSARHASEQVLFDEDGFLRLQRLPAPERAVLNAALWVGLSPWRIAELGFTIVGSTMNDVAKVYARGKALIA